MSYTRYCKEMRIARSTGYYKPKGESQENIGIMNHMDRIIAEHPTAGVKTMVSLLSLLYGLQVNNKRVRRLMRKMGLEATYPRKCLSRGGTVKYVKPYLLRNLTVCRSNQVWSTDITFIPMPHGFMYLYAVIDVYSRYIVGWRLSNTLSASNCTELVEECIRLHGTPEIINSDQGSQYTSAEWERTLTEHGIAISMDGRGRCKDNIWIERFWHTIKQEYIYLNPTDDVPALKDGIRTFIEYYNGGRPHQGIGNQLPAIRYAA